MIAAGDILPYALLSLAYVGLGWCAWHELSPSPNRSGIALADSDWQMRVALALLLVWHAALLYRNVWSDGAINFSVANADTLFDSNTSGVAFSNLAAPESESDSFDFGLPFFFNVNVFTAIAGQSTPGGTGPYVAF